MKAKVYYKTAPKGASKGTSYQKTVEVDTWNPCEAVAAFIAATGASRSTYISHIKIGRKDYQWNGTAYGAYVD